MRLQALLMTSALVAVPTLASAETISILMESVPDTRFVQEVVRVKEETWGR